MTSNFTPNSPPERDLGALDWGVGHQVSVRGMQRLDPCAKVEVEQVKESCYFFFLTKLQ